MTSRESGRPWLHAAATVCMRQRNGVPRNRAQAQEIARCTLHPCTALRFRDLRSHPVAVSELPTPGPSGGLTPVTLAVLTQAVTASEETSLSMGARKACPRVTSPTLPCPSYACRGARTQPC